MVRALALLALLNACAFGPDRLPPRPEGALRVASYNVHYIVLGQETGPWSVADWKRRRGPLASAVRATGADVIAFQEMESFRRGSDGSVNLARDWLLDQVPDLAAAATGDWRSFPSTQPIFYRPEVLRPVDQGWFFFSDTPDVIYSQTFNGSYPAFASWAAFEDRRTGRPVTVVNVHLDAFSRLNRRLSSDLIARRIAPWIADGTAVILAGDLNALAFMGPLRRLEKAGLTFAGVRGATYHFNRGINLFGAIDHVGYANARQVSEPMVLRSRFGGEWPSDHYPVAVDLTY